MMELHRLHEALRNAFSDRDDDYVSRPPDWGKQLEVRLLLELKAASINSSLPAWFTEQVSLPVMIDNQFAIRT